MTISQDKELLMKLAILVKLVDSSGRASRTSTFQQLSVGIVDELMNPANHARYLKLSKDVETELRHARLGDSEVVSQD